MEALHDVVKSGKARYIGASSMWAWQFAKAQHTAELHGWTQFVTMQNHYNLIYREEEREMLPLCADQGVGVIPWSPLARGPAHPPVGLDDEPRREGRVRQRCSTATRTPPSSTRSLAVADERGVKPAQVALAWMLSKSVVTAPIVGSTKVEHLDRRRGRARPVAHRRRDRAAREAVHTAPRRRPLLTFGDAPSPGLSAGARCWGTRRAQGAMFWFRWKTFSGSYVRFTWRSRS